MNSDPTSMISCNTEGFSSHREVALILSLNLEVYVPMQVSVDQYNRETRDGVIIASFASCPLLCLCSHIITHFMSVCCRWNSMVDTKATAIRSPTWMKKCLLYVLFLEMRMCQGKLETWKLRGWLSKPKWSSAKYLLPRQCWRRERILTWGDSVADRKEKPC